MAANPKDKEEQLVCFDFHQFRCRQRDDCGQAHVLLSGVDSRTLSQCTSRVDTPYLPTLEPGKSITTREAEQYRLDFLKCQEDKRNRLKEILIPTEEDYNPQDWACSEFHYLSCLNWADCKFRHINVDGGDAQRLQKYYPRPIKAVQVDRRYLPQPPKCFRHSEAEQLRTDYCRNKDGIRTKMQAMEQSGMTEASPEADIRLSEESPTEDKLPMNRPPKRTGANRLQIPRKDVRYRSPNPKTSTADSNATKIIKKINSESAWLSKEDYACVNFHFYRCPLFGECKFQHIMADGSDAKKSRKDLAQVDYQYLPMPASRYSRAEAEMYRLKWWQSSANIREGKSGKKRSTDENRGRSKKDSDRSRRSSRDLEKYSRRRSRSPSRGRAGERMRSKSPEYRRSRSPLRTLERNQRGRRESRDNSTKRPTQKRKLSPTILPKLPRKRIRSRSPSLDRSDSKTNRIPSRKYAIIAESESAMHAATNRRPSNGSLWACQYFHTKTCFKYDKCAHRHTLEDGEDAKRLGRNLDRVDRRYLPAGMFPLTAEKAEVERLEFCARKNLCSSANTTNSGSSQPSTLIGSSWDQTTSPSMLSTSDCFSCDGQYHVKPNPFSVKIENAEWPEKALPDIRELFISSGIVPEVTIEKQLSDWKHWLGRFFPSWTRKWFASGST